MKASERKQLVTVAAQARDLAGDMRQSNAGRRSPRTRKVFPSEAAVADVATFVDQANPNRARPVKLQVNTAGAWRDVIGFDAGKDVESCEVLGAAETLGRISGATFRVVIKDALQTPLMHWSRDTGWVKR